MKRENSKVVVLGKATRETKGAADGISDGVGRKLQAGLTKD